MIFSFPNVGSSPTFYSVKGPFFCHGLILCVRVRFFFEFVWWFQYMFHIASWSLCACQLFSCHVHNLHTSWIFYHPILANPIVIYLLFVSATRSPWSCYYLNFKRMRKDNLGCYDSLKWLISFMSLAMWYVIFPFSHVLEAKLGLFPFHVSWKKKLYYLLTEVILPYKLFPWDFTMT